MDTSNYRLCQKIGLIGRLYKHFKILAFKVFIGRGKGGKQKKSTD